MAVAAEGFRIVGTMDSVSTGFFAKVGYSFGSEGQQRIEASYSAFKLVCQCNYSRVIGDRDLGITNTVIKGRPPTGQASFNDFSQKTVTYSNDGGGGLSLGFSFEIAANVDEAEDHADGVVMEMVVTR